MKKKLFDLKKWLTLADSARHLSILLDNDVTEADVLRLALDGHLRLSVNFVNHAKARKGKIVGIDEAERSEIPPEFTAVMHNISDEEKGKPLPYISSLRIDENRYLTLEDEVQTIEGVWDLPMIGSETLDVEHLSQCITGGPEVNLTVLDGALVEGKDGDVWQLQDSFKKYKTLTNPRQTLNGLFHYLTEKKIIEASKLEKLHEEFMRKNKKKLEPTFSTTDYTICYYPAGGLPKDAVLVVRTQALRDFEQSFGEGPDNAIHPVKTTDQSHWSDKLAYLVQASRYFWADVDRNEPDTHKPNHEVAAWLEKKGYSPTLADKAATIIRPDWVPTGRKPD